MIKQLFFGLLFIFLCSSAISQDTGRKIQYYNPKWSPDGHSLVFESTRDGKSSIYIIKVDTIVLRLVTDTVTGYGQPGWAPDGKSVVYYGGSRPIQLYTNSIYGDVQRKVIVPQQDCYLPSWSDKNRIAFAMKAQGSTPNNIAVINSDGTGFVQLTQSNEYDWTSSEWLPGGKKILFVRSTVLSKAWQEITTEEMNKKRNSSELMMMNEDGTGIKSIVKPGFEPAFSLSSKGNTIYYIDKHDTNSVVYKIPIDGKKPESLLSLQGVIYAISISPDGKRLAYSAERNKAQAIYIMDLEKKTEVKLIGD